MNQITPRVLVSGGGRRIGAALSAHFARLGFEVWLHVWRSRDAAAELVSTLPDSRKHHITSCDLSDSQARKKWLQSLPEFDLVINNASVYRLTAPGAEETAADRERYHQVNYLAPLEIIQKQYEQKSSISGGKAAITLLDSDILTSGGAVKPFTPPPPGVDSYLASRIQLGHELLALAGKHAPQQRINAIAPGPVLPPVASPAANMSNILKRVPMNRSVDVEEIARAAEFLWSNHSLTGVILPVDGGMHLDPK